MRDKTHIDELERWARYVYDNPDKWKQKIKPFLDSQIKISQRAYKKILQMPNGNEKILRIRKVKIE